MSIDKLHNINGLQSGNLQKVTPKKINEIIDALNNSGTSDYKVYTALLNQDNQVGHPPTAIVLKNTLGASVVFTYNSPGNYTATCTGKFTLNKTICFIGGAVSAFIPRTSDNGDGNSVFIATYNTSGFAPGDGNGGLSNTAFEIRVYN